jgi:uracil-DNA glycosylase family 4
MQLKLLELEEEKEDITQVMKQLSSTCNSCRLSALHPDNRGIIWRGSVYGRIAVIGEAPGDKETERGAPLVGPSGQEWERWASIMKIDTSSDCFLTNIVQCQPAKTEVKGKMSQSAPDDKEISTCFPNRCLRILKALPNLEVVITLGWVAASALLGETASTKSHEGQWFVSDLLPGVPIFCLVHPSFILREPSLEKTKALEYNLGLFYREYVDERTAKILDICKNGK